MTQEHKTKLEQAAEKYIKPIRHQLHLGEEDALKQDLLAFAQTILENPGEWGLEYSTKSFKDLMAESSQLAMGNELLQSQLTEYREALEAIRESRDWEATAPELRDIAKEALKQEE